MNVDLNRCTKWIADYSSQNKEIVAVYLFGSILEPQKKPNDVDIAFLIEESKAVNIFEKSVSYTADLTQRFGYNGFDIVILNKSPLAFRYDIISQGRLIYSANEFERIKFEALSVREYLSFKHCLKQYDEYSLKRWGNKGGQEMFNKEIVFQRANVTESSIKKLEQLKSLSETEFLSNSQHIALAEHYLRLGIDSLIDLSNHIIAVKALGRPSAPKDIIHLLSEGEIIPQDFIPEGIKLVKLRDKLIHLYWEVEASDIYQVLHKELVMINNFLHYLLKAVEKGVAEDNNATN